MTANIRTQFVCVLACAGILLHAVGSACATWSIVMTDTRTGEVAAGTVTCLNQFDLLALVPVVVVGKGAAACQASGDFDGQRRPVIFNGLIAGVDPQAMLAQVALIPGHASRQYGIADVQGRTITFTGPSCAPWAGGLTGRDGDVVYAIQGNILTGECVVANIEAAIRANPWDLPTRLMAGMRAARDAGGDGRCSCPASPPDCGCPPPSFNKSGHIGGVIVARLGDQDDEVCNAAGCAGGRYYLQLNVAYQPASRPDPVDQLMTRFALWRASLAGRPDAIRSMVSFSPAVYTPPDTVSSTMRIELRDWTNSPISVPVQSVVVMHAPDSPGLTQFGTPVQVEPGVFELPLTRPVSSGVDRLVVSVDAGGERPIVLMPLPRFPVHTVGDVNCDALVTLDDIDAFVTALTAPGDFATVFPACDPLSADCNGDGRVDFDDIDAFVARLIGA